MNTKIKFFTLRKSYSKGFTLIELMVTISIIALLSSALIYSLVTARIKARTSRRAQDLSLFQKGIELYRLKNQSVYPSSGAVPTSGVAYPAQNLAALLTPDSLTQIPQDPGVPAAQDYQYMWGDNGKMFAIRINTAFEVNQSTDCAYRSPGEGGVTNNLFTGLPNCNFE